MTNIVTLEPLVILGQLNPFFETGTEGVVWSVVDDGLPGFDGLFPLSNGDRLIVYGAEGEVVWEGTISLEYTSRQQPFPHDPSKSQQQVAGLWVNGLQRDVDPDTWAQWFIDRRPAAVRLKSPGHVRESSRALQQAITLMESDPLAAWGFLENHHESLLRRVASSIEHAWNHACSQMGWQAHALKDAVDMAEAWQALLALTYAKRVLWTTNEQDTLQVLQQRFPTPAEMDPTHWLAQRLPADGRLR